MFALRRRGGTSEGRAIKLRTFLGTTTTNPPSVLNTSPHCLLPRRQKHCHNNRLSPKRMSPHRDEIHHRHTIRNRRRPQCNRSTHTQTNSRSTPIKLHQASALQTCSATKTNLSIPHRLHQLHLHSQPLHLHQPTHPCFPPCSVIRHAVCVISIPLPANIDDAAGAPSSRASVSRCAGSGMHMPGGGGMAGILERALGVR
jgi:hypothetical protein